MKHLRRIWAAGLAASAISLAAHAQGVLSVTPGRTAATVAGTGALGYGGDNGAAAAASLASPSAIAYDASGNLFFADTANHAVREVLKSTNTIITVAGTGVAGFSGDGGAAASAQLDTPMGIALDASGSLYIADAHNHRVRKVTGSIITTIAGTGMPGFSGDGAQATAAQLALPSALAVDASGRLLIADTNNQRVRAVANGVITTLAGNGEELFAGDGGAATAASLDQPSGVAVDAAGNVYIADKANQRIRMVNGSGVISTFAGSGGNLFSGAFSGDGGTAAAALLARPLGVSVDAAGIVLIADTNNQRIRQVTGGAIATIAGSGEQGFGGDGGALGVAALNAPRAAAFDLSGGLLVADTNNQRLRSGSLPALNFAGQAIGTASSPQNITLANTGTADLTISQVKVSGAFTVVSGGSCTALPVVLGPGNKCTEQVAFLPVSAGIAAGSVVVSGTNVVSQTVLLAGTGLQGATVTTLTADSTSALVGQPVSLTATVTGGGSGTVSFYEGLVQLGTARPLTNSIATITLSSLAAGTHSITAVYSGDANFAGSTSAPVLETVGDFDFNLTASGGLGSGDQTVVPGQPATYAFTVQPLAGPFNFPVTLSATGLPPGASVTFSPQIVTVGAAPVSFTMKVQTTTAVGMNRSGRFGGGTLAFAFLLLPFSSNLRRKARKLGPLTVCLMLAGTGFVLTTLTGCAGGNGFFGQAQKTYTIQVIGTAKGSTGTTLQHVANVQLTLE